MRAIHFCVTVMKEKIEWITLTRKSQLLHLFFHNTSSIQPRLGNRLSQIKARSVLQLCGSSSLNWHYLYKRKPVIVYLVSVCRKVVVICINISRNIHTQGPFPRIFFFLKGWFYPASLLYHTALRKNLSLWLLHALDRKIWKSWREVPKNSCDIPIQGQSPKWTTVW